MNDLLADIQTPAGAPGAGHEDTLAYSPVAGSPATKPHKKGLFHKRDKSGDKHDHKHDKDKRGSLGTKERRGSLKESKRNSIKPTTPLEKELFASTEDGEFMAEFFEQVGEMKKNILFIEETTRKLEAVTTQKSLDNMSDMLSETNCYIAQVRDALLLIGNQNAELGDNPKIAASSEYSIRVNAFNSIKSRFFDVARKYEEAQLKARNKEKEVLERRIKIVNPQATQEEVDQMIETGENAFETKLLDKKRHQEAKEMLEHCETQRAQLHQLEQSIVELHQLFLDMALLVDEQGEMINVIEANVNKTVAYVAEANAELKIALKYSNSARKKVAFLVAGVAAGVVAGGAAIAAKFALIGV